ncbi:MAG: Crp/Fnr family transcriptional regulator [Rubrivivax sp.]|nr:Crp/Fnr family transcriptional regulator [Rubrivivax sp.]
MTPSPQNHLIELLPRRDRTRLLALCEPVELSLAQVVGERGTPARHVWFPVNAFVSLVAQVDEHPGLEVGMVGREGMVGAALALGVAVCPLKSVVQGAGSAWRLSAAPFRAELAQSVALRNVLGRYLYVRMDQLATSAACLRYHLISARLARWLLMSQDRAHQDHFHTTHVFLAYMLGVRRVGVTVAAGELQRQGLIRYHRGEIHILDRSGLEKASCACYQLDQQAYAAHLGSTGSTHTR